jgi:DNA-binding PadR family transcriptional regulator
MNFPHGQFENFLPLREPTHYILLSLANGEKHGYAIIKTIAELSRGKCKLSTSTLYEALSRLVEQGLIEQLDAEITQIRSSATEDGRSRTRKVYGLTFLGIQVLRAETERMHSLITITRLRLNEKPT